MRRLIVGLLFGLFSLSAFADYSGTVVWVASDYTQYQASSPEGVCAILPTPPGVSYTYYADTNTTGTCRTNTASVAIGRYFSCNGTLQQTQTCFENTTTTTVPNTTTTTNVCPYGYLREGSTCKPITCPAGQHFGATQQAGLTINRCIDDCPPNTISNINPTTHIQICGPKPPDDKDKPNTSDGNTCPPTYTQIGFDGQGKALCRAGPMTDPCPRGTHNISADPANPNCTTNNPGPETTTNVTEKPPVTSNNSDGSTTKTETKETTYPDGSKMTETTTTTTHSDGTKSTNTTQSCSREGACGGAVVSGGGGGGGSKGSGDGSGDGDKNKEDHVTPQSGELYSKSEKTFGTVFSNFNNQVNNAPFMAAAKGFFTLGNIGGACPSWTVAVAYWNKTLDIGQYFCGGNASAILSLLGIGVMVGAAWAAFRMAFL